MVTVSDIRPGMDVRGGDDVVIGQVEELTPIGMRVSGGHLFPLSAIERIEDDRIYFHNPAAQYVAQTGPQSDVAQRELTVELAEHDKPVPGAAGPAA